MGRARVPAGREPAENSGPNPCWIGSVVGIGKNGSRGRDPSQKTQQVEDDYETEPLPPRIPRAPVRSPICLVVESGVLVDLGGLQLAVGNRLLQA